MLKPHHLLFALLPLFAGCQLLDPRDPPAAPKAVRLQGDIRLQGDSLRFTPCGELRQFTLDGPLRQELRRQVGELQPGPDAPLFADLSGELGASSKADSDGRYAVSDIYRLQAEGHGCSDPNFARLLLRASGHEPEWNLNVSSKGLVLERPGQPALALPYLEEQLPDGRFNISSAADGLRLELWLTPERCSDSMSGSLQHLRAELRLDDQVLHGCAAFGAQRSQ